MRALVLPFRAREVCGNDSALGRIGGERRGGGETGGVSRGDEANRYEAGIVPSVAGRRCRAWTRGSRARRAR